MMLRWLVELPRWLLVGVLFYAPLAYGCTRPWTITLLNLLLTLVLGLWGLGCLARRSGPVLPRALVGAVLIVGVLGWWMVGNAHGAYDPVQHIFIPVQPWVRWLPGSVDGATSAEMMWRVTVLLGTLLFVCEAARSAQWRCRFLQALVASGVVLVGFGLFHRVSGIPAEMWPHERFEFATYRYHPNAGALINLATALALGLLGWAWRAGGGLSERVLGIFALAVLVAGGLVNASKAAQAILLLTLLAAGFWQAVLYSRREQRGIRWPMIGGALLVLVVAGVLVNYVGGQVALRRWREMGSSGWSNEYRLGAYQVCLDILPHSGFFGFGPGTFAEVFPHFTERFGSRLAGVWRHAHNDYLQGLIDYGWISGLALATIFLGGLRRCGQVMAQAWATRTGTGSWDSFQALPISLALLGIALHALVDFPLQIASLQLFVVTILGCAWAMRVPPRTVAAKA